MNQFQLSQINSLPIYSGEEDYTGNFFSTSPVHFGGYKSSNSQIHLIIQCEKDDLIDVNISGLEINKVSVNDPNSSGVLYFFDFCPRLGHFLENVIIICNEVIGLIEKGNSTVAATTSVLEKWEYFLRQPRTKFLSDSQIMGLFGELQVLIFCLELGMSKSLVIDAWKGPEKLPHDFTFENIDIEVKTTRRLDGLIEIHGLEQLDELGSKLFLWVMSISDDPNSLSLNDLVFFIEEFLADAVLIMNFRDKLVLIGYHPEDQIRYDRLRFMVNNESVYHVDDNFPRITSIDINTPERFRSLSYTINTMGLLSVDKYELF